jgi:hypothetical protein
VCATINLRRWLILFSVLIWGFSGLKDVPYLIDRSVNYSSTDLVLFGRQLDGYTGIARRGLGKEHVGRSALPVLDRMCASDTLKDSP